MADNEFHIKSESPAAGDMMFWSLVGHEGLSRPSVYELTVLSKLGTIDASDVLGHAFDIVVDFADADGGKHERHCQGHAVRFVRVAKTGRYFEYRIQLRSWFWLLTRRQNSRILQDKPVLDVMNAVFEDSPIKRFKKIKSDHVTAKHAPRRYSVQHQESDYNYLSRLMEEEGVYYWFDAHDAPGTMHLSDNSGVAHDKLPVADTLRYAARPASEVRAAEITRWVSARRLDTGKHAAIDSNFKTIRRKIGATIDASDNHELADFETFEFPGGYFDSDTAESTAKIRADELTSRRDRHWAITHWADVAVGRSFKFQGDPDGGRDGEYFISGCSLVLTHPGYEGMSGDEGSRPIAALLAESLADDAVNADVRDVVGQMVELDPSLGRVARGACVFLLTVQPADIAFKPPRLTPRPVMPGPQSAIVVGPSGDELHVDEHGRVKVHFHWDRYDESNEKSTCWVRVSQPWAGKAWGGYFIPRIGQEVIVDFLNGDPDRPIITGRLYNDDQPIPYKSPTQSGFKTRSTPGGGTGNFNEIMFEDKKGEEVLSIHAELEMARSVERDDSTTVGRDQTVAVKRDHTTSIERDSKTTVMRNETRTINVDQKNTVKGAQNNQVVGNRVTFVDANDTTTVAGTSITDVTGARTDTSRAGETRNVVGNQTVTVSGNVTYKAAKMSFEAGHIDWLVTGASSKYITVPTGPLHLMANKIKLMSNTGIESMAVGNIDATSVGSNTTVLGPNTSGYIGMNSEANLGMARSTFMGMSIDNALAIAICNFAGVAIENTLAVKMVNCAGPELNSSPVNLEYATLKQIAPGAGAGAAAGAAVAGVLGAVAGAASAATDIAATLKQYADAAAALDIASKEAAAAGLPGLAGRLAALAGATRTRRVEGIIAAIPVVGTLAVVGAEAVIADRGLKTTAEQLADDTSRNANNTAAAPPPPDGEIDPTQPFQPPKAT